MGSRRMEAKIHELSQRCKMTVLVTTINAKVLANLAFILCKYSFLHMLIMKNKVNYKCSSKLVKYYFPFLEYFYINPLTWLLFLVRWLPM